MPDKITTETQLIRKLGDGDKRVEIVLFATGNYMDRVRDPAYRSENTPVEHLRQFYRSYPEVRDLEIDGLIITGAPVERNRTRMCRTGTNCLKSLIGRRNAQQVFSISAGQRRQR